MGKEWDCLDVGLPQEGVWKGRRGKGGSNIGDDRSKPSSRHRVALGMGKKQPFKRCIQCSKRQFSGSPCECEKPDWVVEYPDGAPSSSIRAGRWHELWAVEALRVLKPGGMLLSFGGTRTFHRLTCALEDAGFEIRDCLMWLYGSGFPKSLDVSKAIDKAGEWNAEFDDVRSWLREKVKEKGLKHGEIDRAIGNENSHMASHFLGTSQPMLPTWKQWVIIKTLLGVDEDIDRPPKCISYERAIIGFRKVHRGVAFTSDGPDELPITAPGTDAAKEWDGWGTALKPAWEPIILAMKPLDGTFSQNALKHGVAGLNVDGCRIGANSRPLREGDYKKTADNVYEGRQDSSLMGGSKAIG
ncbi:hypothetical protein LCGC14_2681940, partial [marine sediment metagenome]